MIPVLEVTPIVPSFLQESKRTGASSFEKLSSKGISASQRLKCSLDLFFQLETLLRNSVVAAAEVCLE